MAVKNQGVFMVICGMGVHKPAEIGVAYRLGGGAGKADEKGLEEVWACAPGVGEGSHVVVDDEAVAVGVDDSVAEVLEIRYQEKFQLELAEVNLPAEVFAEALLEVCKELLDAGFVAGDNKMDMVAHELEGEDPDVREHLSAHSQDRHAGAEVLVGLEYKRMVLRSGCVVDAAETVEKVGALLLPRIESLLYHNSPNFTRHDEDDGCAKDRPERPEWHRKQIYKK